VITTSNASTTSCASLCRTRSACLDGVIDYVSPNTYEQQRYFTADASRELGMPVAIVLTQNHHVLARLRTNEKYVAACRSAAERMKAARSSRPPLPRLLRFRPRFTPPRPNACPNSPLVSTLAKTRKATMPTRPPHRIVPNA
jgi:hypothetical protein